MDKKILAVCSIRHCTDRLIPVFRKLRQKYPLHIFCLGEMSSLTVCPGPVDPRESFFKEFDDIITHGCSYRRQVTHRKTKRNLCKSLNLNQYGLALIDDNLCKSSWGFQSMYAKFKSKNILVVAATHGNREKYERFIRKNITRAYDYTFVFGRKERNYISPHLSSRCLPGGLPTNDVLNEYELNSKYILVVLGFVKGIKTQRGYRRFTEAEFYRSGLLNISKDLNLPIVIKEKRTQKKQSLALENLAMKHENVSVVMDVKDDNKLICDAACLISAPSTLCFKSIQRGIPTVLLRRFGMLGSFHDFSGVCEINERRIRLELDRQMNAGRCENWIKQSIEGGLEYDSTNVYVRRIEKLIRNMK